MKIAAHGASGMTEAGCGRGGIARHALSGVTGPGGEPPRQRDAVRGVRVRSPRSYRAQRTRMVAGHRTRPSNH
jgi:hypothetical protein